MVVETDPRAADKVTGERRGAGNGVARGGAPHNNSETHSKRAVVETDPRAADKVSGAELGTVWRGEGRHTPKENNIFHNYS